MQPKKILLSLAAAAIILGSCGGNNSAEDTGRSTPIDSTNTKGTAPATYGGDNPANDQDTNYINSSDTGTRISTGRDNTVE